MKNNIPYDLSCLFPSGDAIINQSEEDDDEYEE